MNGNSPKFAEIYWSSTSNSTEGGVLFWDAVEDGDFPFLQPPTTITARLRGHTKLIRRSDGVWRTKTSIDRSQEALVKHVV